MGTDPVEASDRFLAGREVHLWIARTEVLRVPGAVPTGLSWLTSEERARYDRFIPDHAKEEFLLGRLLLRSVLSDALSSEPRAVRFEIAEHGKPTLAGVHGAERLDFNLSHTRGLVVCILGASRAIGIDAEAIDPKRAGPDIAKRFFSPAETQFLSQFEGEQYQSLFTKIWTLKEAYIKARGLGLSLPLDKFSFQLDPSDGVAIGIGFEAEMNDDSAAWQFNSVPIDERHVVSTAIRRGADRDLEILRRDFSFSPR